MSNPDLLHIYSQQHEHDEAFIIGNRAGLEKLKRAIEKALEKNNGVSSEEVMVNDGEGFDVYVALCEKDWQSKTWVNMMVPYTKDYSQESRNEAVSPETFIKIKMDKETETTEA